jgi:hypothetical protein
MASVGRPWCLASSNRKRSPRFALDEAQVQDLSDRRARASSRSRWCGDCFAVSPVDTACARELLLRFLGPTGGQALIPPIASPTR